MNLLNLIILLLRMPPVQPNSGIQQGQSQSSMALLNNNSRLWKQSQATLSFTAPHLSFTKEQRFKLHSIYWPEVCQNVGIVNNKRKSQANELALKISKLIDEQEKNEMRMNKHKRAIPSHRISYRKEMGMVISSKKSVKLSRDNEEVVKRLTTYQKVKQSTLRDLHGNRCNLYQDPECEFKAHEISYMWASTGFKTSRKMRLELPHNYYPGPGAYEIKRYLSQLDGSDWPAKRKPQSPAK